MTTSETDPSRTIGRDCPSIRSGNPLSSLPCPRRDAEGAGGVCERDAGATAFVRSESEFTLAVDRGRSPAFLMEPRGTLVWANKAMLDRMDPGGGKEHADVLSSAAGKVVASRSEIDTVLCTLKSAPCRISLESSRGATVLEGFVFPVQRTGGPVVLGGVFAEDDSEHPAEPPVTPGAEYLTACLHLLPVLAYAKDANLRFTWVSPAVVRRLGLSLDQIVGRTDAELGVAVPVQLGSEQDAQVLAEGKTRAFQESFLRDDGSPGSWSGYRFPLTDSHGTGIGAAFIDTSDGVRAQRQLSERDAFWSILFDRSPMGHVVTDLGLRITEANSALAGLLRVSRSELRNMTLADIPPPQEWETERALLRELLDGRRSQYRLRKHLVGSDRVLVPVSVLFATVRAGDGSPRAVLGMIQTEESAPGLRRTALPLNDDEVRLLGVVADGAGDRQAARILGMGESTVRLRLATLKHRLEAKNRAHLIARAYELGILPVQAADP